MSEVSRLRVKVVRMGKEVADITMPARCAYWIKTLLPKKVKKDLHRFNIDIDAIQEEIKRDKNLRKMEIFRMNDETKDIRVWLE